MSDRLGRRKVLVILNAFIAALCIYSFFIMRGEGELLQGAEGAFMQAISLAFGFLLGGMMWPVYSVASALAFDRADKDSLVDVSTTLLVVNTIGAIAGPMLVLALEHIVGAYSLSFVILLASIVTVGVAVIRSVMVEEPEESRVASIAMPESSIEMAKMAAETVSEERKELQENAEDSDDAESDESPAKS